MINGDKISAWWRELFRRRRLAMFSSRDGREVWYTHISPLNIFMAILTILILMFGIVLSLATYSAVLEILPGYKNKTIETHRAMIESIVRIDSMERVINNMMIYSENVAMIMSGNVAQVDAMILADTISLDKNIVSPSSIDTALRAQMEGEGRYNIAATTLGGEVNMIAPVSGKVTTRFDIDEGSYGVEILAANDQRVVAAQRGSVVMVHWTAESDYVFEIMHPNNMLSIYRNIKSVMVQRGESVKIGGVIGENKRDREIAVGFEIWSEGRPLDPERYIMF